MSRKDGSGGQMYCKPMSQKDVLQANKPVGWTRRTDICTVSQQAGRTDREDGCISKWAGRTDLEVGRTVSQQAGMAHLENRQTIIQRALMTDLEDGRTVSQQAGRADLENGRTISQWAGRTDQEDGRTVMWSNELARRTRKMDLSHWQGIGRADEGQTGWKQLDHRKRTQADGPGDRQKGNEPGGRTLAKRTARQMEAWRTERRTDVIYA